MSDLQVVLVVAAAWLGLNGLLLLLRFLRSTERAERLKTYGVGVGLLAAFFVVVAFGSWLLPLIGRWANSTPEGSFLGTAIAFGGLLAGVIFILATIFLLFAHVAATIESWSSSDATVRRAAWKEVPPPLSC